MRTEALIEMLARGAGPAPRAAVARRLLPVMLAGLVVSSLLALWIIGPLPPVMFQTPVPWIKLLYALALAGAAAALTTRLARPIARLRVPVLVVLLVIGAMAAGGAVFVALTPQDARAQAVFGQTWLVCPWMLMGISLPTLAGILWTLRSLAPTQLRKAGFAGGLLAGAIGAAGYSLACPESSAAFVAIWYTLGILLTGLLGGALGARVLRW
ncbi:DUF1109 domain-containing protein [uncultured Hydrogenophaga sp.]|uniref:DUF1109 domain-containing protein n=1 Tax=uncultured Hydrogenophaga sp. TaxID=199683 RepID=UPI00266013A5|nr:DUF1109 domain-containing protein [uncultured Hydrogenophaga sp.]